MSYRNVTRFVCSSDEKLRAIRSVRLSAFDTTAVASPCLRRYALVVKPELPIWTDPERLGGRPCFAGTRVPVDALFENLEAGLNLDEFLTEFEGVTREQAVAVLELARRSVAEPAAA